MRTFVMASVFCATTVICGVASAERPHAEAAKAPRPERMQTYVEKGRPTEDGMSARSERPSVMVETRGSEMGLKAASSAAKPEALTAKLNLGRPDGGTASAPAALTHAGTTAAHGASSSPLPTKLATKDDAARPGDDTMSPSRGEAQVATTSESAKSENKSEKAMPYQLEQANRRTMERALKFIHAAMASYFGTEEK